ncbi:transcriptional regulator [Actinomadura logoneensis]|uniref:Transcriptional regulator n=1 Tax=Actinomadura logoneensis TaxID=2293572 RepID=A0A372JKF8_9ACTN|nr:helix-turn-helix domain-containing protein [Actinomadura logoneensis]RFU40507.1 transcriptional regulator [Actinomadura logoneensis]
MDFSGLSEHSPEACRARETLDRVAEKWTLMVIALLGERTKRFGELKRECVGVSQRMLTVTLRGLERDGFVVRTVYPEIPPRVEYTLTKLGRTMLEAIEPLIVWTESHGEEIDAARAAYDGRTSDG